MAAALEAINGLTAATETANVLAKAASSVTETIGKALANIVNLFIQPLAPLMIWLMQQIVSKFIAFKEWWDNLPTWIDEKVFQPVLKFLHEYFIDPIMGFFKDVWKWIDINIITPLKTALVNLKKWIDDTWNWWKTAFENIPIWIDENLVQPFWKWVDNAGKWIKEHIETPFWNTVNAITAWIDEYITKPFFKAVSDVSVWVKTYISDPFWNTITTIKGYLDTLHKWVDDGFKAIANAVLHVINWLLGAARTIASSVGLGSSVPADIPYLQSGGFVKETGVAVVHKGESVIPAGGGRNITLNFYGYQDDVFINKVKDVLRAQGTVYNL